MYNLVFKKQPIGTVGKLDDDDSDEEIWELIDKEDDGNNILC